MFFVFGVPPPSSVEVEQTVSPSVIYQDAYYSNEKDVPDRPREYAGREFKLESNTLPFLPAFDKNGGHGKKKGVLDRAREDLLLQRRRRNCSLLSWQIMRPPPTWDDVVGWLGNEDDPLQQQDRDALDIDGPPPKTKIKRQNRPDPELSQIEGPTQANRHGFKFTMHKPSTSRASMRRAI